ncbi:MtnX-like HAD-IB family phosphatase [Thermoanaerobacterium sp. DL9XJH110]|uniref:MtnX-like HAD-IB family phosphatase n=1 Tax=Thermoanaerobacterium sp. DL9XJH110 TaxID=3386643 RepID=UPI003BB50A56
MVVTFFVDFDGTITKQDTCDAMAKAFARGDWESIDLLWKERRLSTEDCARETFKLFDADGEKLKKFLQDNIEIDDYFIPFLKLCGKKGYMVYVLSDGYDFNIDTVFKKYGITDIPYYSNRLIIDGSLFDIECTHRSVSCPQCGTCKTEIMEKLKPENGLAVYIGDGYSDICPAKKADVVFAKESLLSYCRKNSIPARSFKDFEDIINWVSALS